MSNGNSIFTYTQEQEAGLFAQFSKSMEIARERQRPYDTIKQSLQAIISDDVIVQVTPKVIASADGGKVLHVTGNFDSAALALEAGNYDGRYGFAESAKQIAKVPMIVQPVDRKVRAVPLGQFRKNSELFELYPKMADPMTLFTLGAKFPKEQLDAPIFVVWKDHLGQFMYAVLHRGVSRRSVRVRQDHPDGGWNGYDRVLLCE